MAVFLRLSVVYICFYSSELYWTLSLPFYVNFPFKLNSGRPSSIEFNGIVVSGSLGPDICRTITPSVAWVLHLWPLAILLKLLKCAAFHLLPLLIQPCTPPNWLSWPNTPPTTNPHLHLTHKTAPKPPRRQQHRWIVYCASKIPDNPHPERKEESFDPWSILGQITKSKSPSQSLGKKQPSSEHIKSLMASHMWGGPPYQHINTIILVYPWPVHIPTPIKPPNSELVWPLRILPARPRLTPWAETMATSWE